MGTGKDMQFRDKGVDPFADGYKDEPFSDNLDVTELCVTQLTGRTKDGSPAGNADGVNLDVIVQKFDPRGTTLYKSRVDPVQYPRRISGPNGGSEERYVNYASLPFMEYTRSDFGGSTVQVGQNVTHCVQMDEMLYDFKFQPRKVGRTNETYFEQNALTYTMELDGGFEASVYTLAFDYDDDTQPADRRKLTKKLGAPDRRTYSVADNSIERGIDTSLPKEGFAVRHIEDEGRTNFAYNKTGGGIKVGVSIFL